MNKHRRYFDNIKQLNFPHKKADESNYIKVVYSVQTCHDVKRGSRVDEHERIGDHYYFFKFLACLIHLVDCAVPHVHESCSREVGSKKHKSET